jgi:hypothetical protein
MSQKRKCSANDMYFHHLCYVKRRQPNTEEHNDTHCPSHLMSNCRIDKWYQCHECDRWICSVCFKSPMYIDFKPIQKYHPKRMDAYGTEWPATSNSHLYCYHCVNSFESLFEQDKEYAKENSWRTKPEPNVVGTQNPFYSSVIDSNSDTNSE